MKTLLNRTGVLAFTAALTVLAAQAGNCSTLNPQPLPPHGPPPEHIMLAFFLHLVHLIRL